MPAVSKSPTYSNILSNARSELTGQCERCGAVSTFERDMNRLAGIGISATDGSASHVIESERRWEGLSRLAAQSRDPVAIEIANAARTAMLRAREAALVGGPDYRHDGCGGRMRFYRVGES